jgi:alpha-tubulin suppressor-like RCC1 family protein
MIRAGALLLACAACGFSVQGAPDVDAQVDAAAVDAPFVPPDTPSVEPGCQAAEVVAGGGHSCARMMDGSVFCWGLTDYGQVGISPLPMRCPIVGASPYCSPSPAKVQVSNAVALGLGEFHTCAATTGGTLCWGLNKGGFGDGTTFNSQVPSSVPQRMGATRIAAGVSHTCSIAGGRVSCSGLNAAGEVGNNSVLPQPVATEVLQGASAVALGDYTSCAVDEQQQLHCWGRNTYRQIDGSGLNHLTPTVIAGADDVVDVAVGRHHVCTAKGDGTAQCWGNNTYGQLGNESTATISPPVAVTVPAIAQIVAARNYTCVLDGNGAVFCFGEGYGTTPVQVVLPRAATSVTAGALHACAVTDDASVWCWGNNMHGQLGNGSFGEAQISTPQRVQFCP